MCVLSLKLLCNDEGTKKTIQTIKRKTCQKNPHNHAQHLPDPIPPGPNKYNKVLGDPILQHSLKYQFKPKYNFS